MADEPKLTDKERRFIDAYIGPARFNGAAAARMAGYSEKNARFTARDMLTKPHIRARVDAVLEAETLTAAEILHEITAVAIAPTEHFMQVVRPPMTDQHGNEYEAIVKQDYSAKMKALELLGKNRRLFAEQVNVNGTLTFGDLLSVANGAPDPGAGAGDPPAGE